MTLADLSEPDAPPYFQLAANVLTDLQQSFAEMLSALPGPVHRAVDLERKLKLDKRLAWQVFKIAGAANPLAETANVPAPSSIRRLLDAAATAKVRVSVRTQVSNAFDRFEKFVEENSGSRAEFLSAMRGLGVDAGGKADLNVRKSLFQGNAQTWGLQASSLVRTIVFNHKMIDGQRIVDSLIVRGEVGLMRLRQNAPLTIQNRVRPSNHPAQNDPRAAAPSTAPTADGARELACLELLQQFSSDPLPEMVMQTNPNGTVQTNLVFPPSGRKGAVTLHTMQYTPATWTGDQPLFQMSVLVPDPTETLVCEMLIPAGNSDPGSTRAAVYGRRASLETVFECRPVDLLPQHETMTHVGTFTSPPPIQSAPNHAAAVEFSLKQVGWHGQAFDVYRCTVLYPVLHTMVRMVVDSVLKS